MARLSSSSAFSSFSSAASLCTTSSLERVHKHYNQTRGDPIRFCHSFLGSPGTVSTHFPSKSALVMCMRWTLSSMDCSWSSVLCRSNSYQSKQQRNRLHVCHGTLQYIAVYYSTLQYIAVYHVHYSKLQCITVYYSIV